MQISFNDFITNLRNYDYNNNSSNILESGEISEICNQLLLKTNHFIDATNPTSDGLWEIIKETKNTVTIHITDDSAATIIPVFAYIITPNNIYDKMILKSTKIQQGINYDSDLDEIYLTYHCRNTLLPFEPDIISTFNNIIKTI